ncbi:hypothetical protein I302_100210 [Kwoniella bestiolae CBS 10118]|uniref:Mediator of RNA polymerase II transcription subunit 11 n=1 Tax=Kwoniella bestiolae CBS 10118 TaxID=1296100 RepID=A0A1B9G4D3_9TREE|nr:hypothetical protein I302_03583 [Kwoniella bestiolae CBS 10118]OCF25907.1 hypothetical protein I302_03583 [Kwoniella bestiolae CBS 10118]
MSSPAVDAASISDGLELESLDSESLFNALTNVEKAIPELLSSVKPILSHLVSPNASNDEESSGMRAREGVERYMDLLDKIQFILRQTVYYLHATKISSEVLIPPKVDNIPTPFANSLSPSGSKGEVGLGLYGSRIESRVLDDMRNALRDIREEEQQREGTDGLI